MKIFHLNTSSPEFHIVWDQIGLPHTIIYNFSPVTIIRIYPVYGLLKPVCLQKDV